METAVTVPQLIASIRVLIVDDEPLFIEMVEAMLGGEEGIEIVGTAPGGQEAVRPCGANSIRM